MDGRLFLPGQRLIWDVKSLHHVNPAIDSTLIWYSQWLKAKRNNYATDSSSQM